MLPMRPCSACGFEHPEGVVICPSTQQVIGTAVVGGRYRLDRLIAVGGIGAVYDARALHIDRRVAVKRLLPVYTSDPEVVRRFQREARAAGRIEHPNVVEVLDFGVGEDGVPFLVMEFLEGDTLAARLEQAPGQRLPFEDLVPIVLDVLEALGHAHSRGIIHRDLKPENIFIAHKPNGTTVVKLVDLGISKALGSTSQAITQSGSALGTPHYMAPEQLRGEKDVDGRVDLYAMGVVMYRALSGAFPFDGRTFEHLVTRILDGTCAPLSSIVPGLPVGVSEAVAWAMHKDREQRAPTAEALAASLAAFAPPRPLTPAPLRVSSAPPGHAAARVSRPSVSESVPAAPAAPSLAADPTLDATTQRRSSASPVAPDAAPPGESFQMATALASVAAKSQPPRRAFRWWLLLTLVAAALAAGGVAAYFLLRTEREPPPREHPPSGGLAASHLLPPAAETDAADATGLDAATPSTADAMPSTRAADAPPDGGASAAAADAPLSTLDGHLPARPEAAAARRPDAATDRTSADAHGEAASAESRREDIVEETASSPDQPLAADAARLFRQAEAAVRACAGDEGPGSYRVVAVVRGSDGHVIQTHVTSELSASSVECVRRLISDLSFPAFRKETLSLGWNFEVEGPAATDGGTPAPDGGESIERTVRRILYRAKRRALACVAGSTGPVVLIVDIDGSAHRASLRRIDGSVTPAEEACLREVVESTEIPDQITESSSGIPFPLRD